MIVTLPPQSETVGGVNTTVAGPHETLTSTSEAHVIVGAVTSIVPKLNEHDDELPAASVAVNCIVVTDTPVITVPAAGT